MPTATKPNKSVNSMLRAYTEKNVGLKVVSLNPCCVLEQTPLDSDEQIGTGLGY